MSSLFVLPTVNSYNISCAKNHWKGSGELKDTAQKLLSNNASEILLSLKKNFAPRGTHEIHIQFHEIRLHSRITISFQVNDIINLVDIVLTTDNNKYIPTLDVDM